jgi:tetratricopeptide (TPR) repeat protein
MYSDPGDVALQAVVFHESSHQFLNRYTYDAPKWLNEGLAEYFEGWKVREGEPAVRRPHFYDLAVVKQSLADDKPLGLRELVEMDRKVFDDFTKKYPSLDPYLHYATSWSIVYHCLEGDVEEDRERLIAYLKELTSKPSGAEFEVDDWPAFIARWRETVTGLEPEPTDAADHFIIASGARRSGDLLASVLSLQKAVELDSMLPKARYWLGYCYYKLGGRNQAREEFQAAMEVDPEDPSPVYYLARLELGVDYEGEAPDAKGALDYAERASDMVDDENPLYLWLVARCQLELGEVKDAIRTAKKMVKVADDESREAWEEAADEIEEEAKEL